MKTLGRVARAGAVIVTLTAMAGCGTLRAPYTGPVVSVPDVCADLSATIYFERDSAALTREATAVIRGAAAQAESCHFRNVDVFGLSDPVGSPAANIALSQRRAEAVSKELSRLGFTEVTFKLVAGGDAGAMTASGEVQPLRRRADIVFRSPR